MTAMRLAEHVEHTTDVNRMLEQMSPQQFAEWCAKDRVEPIGHAGTHEILSQIAAMVAQFMGAEDVKPGTFKHWQIIEEKSVDTDVAVQALQMIGARKV